MRAQTALIFALVLSPACTEIIHAPLPEPPSGSRALLVAIEHQGAIDVEAVALEDTNIAPALPYLDDFSGNARVVALYYQHTLAELSLSAGPIARATAVDRGPLPTADHAFAAEVRDDRIEPFLPISAASPGELLGAFEIDRSIAHDCFSYDQHQLGLGTMAAPQTITRYNENTALVVSELGEFFLVTSSSVTRSPIVVRDAAPVAAYRTPQGEIWLGAQGGVVLRGDLSRGFHITETRPHQHQFAFLAGPPDSSTLFEMFASTISGEFERFDPQTERWETLVDRQTPPIYTYGALLWLGAHRAATTPPFTREIILYENNALRSVELLPSLGEVRTLAQLKDGGVIGFADPPVVARVEGDDYRVIAQSPASKSPRSAVASGEGFIYLASGGFLIHWQPVDGYCPPDQVDIGSAIPLRTLALGDHIFVVTVDDDGSDGVALEAKVVVLTRSAGH